MKIGDTVRLLVRFMVNYNATEIGELAIISGNTLDKNTFKVDVRGTTILMTKDQFELVSDDSVAPDGSKRFNSGKIQTREIDPNFILGMGEVLTKSREKYEHFNWCKPTKLSTPMESMERHLLAFKAGQDTDPEDGVHHLLKAAVNIMFQYYHITNNPEYSDDRFFKKDKK